MNCLGYGRLRCGMGPAVEILAESLQRHVDAGRQKKQCMPAPRNKVGLSCICKR